MQHCLFPFSCFALVEEQKVNAESALFAIILVSSVDDHCAHLEVFSL